MVATLSYCRGGSRLDTNPAVAVHAQVAVKSNNTTKRIVLTMPGVSKKKNPTKEYNLGYFTLWWNRMVREGMKEETERLGMERMARDKRKLKEMLMMTKDRRDSRALTPEVISNFTENDVTTAQSYENDRLINGWPLTSSSPSSNDEISMTLVQLQIIKLEIQEWRNLTLLVKVMKKNWRLSCNSGTGACSGDGVVGAYCSKTSAEDTSNYCRC